MTLNTSYTGAEYKRLDYFATKSSIPLKLSVALTATGGIFLLLELIGRAQGSGWQRFLLSFGAISVGATSTFYYLYRGTTPGIRNSQLFFRSLTSRGLFAWGLCVALTGFYVQLYFVDDQREWFKNLIFITDPLSMALRDSPADRWFLYGVVYTLSILVMGMRMLMRYRHSRYHKIRTLSVMFFQLGFAFLIPGFLKGLSGDEYYLTYFWPLRKEALFPSDVHQLLDRPGYLGTFMVFWGLISLFLLTPLLTFFYGKRWYCSWVCGCGGLAETAGDPFRHLSSKSEGAWILERWLIHLVLLAITLLTLLLWACSWWEQAFLQEWILKFKTLYGLLIASVFSGVVGVGFYPILGSRVWCRFGCPMAAILGAIQRIWSRFRITTNGDQCISCGNCSTYCEMGIDVRMYAQRGENIVRSSCVGCGVCAAVCPRGVLKLENDKPGDRFAGSETPISALRSTLLARQSSG